MSEWDLKAERLARIEELEKRQTRRPSLGVKWPLALIGIATSAFLLWQMQLDVVYFFSQKTPISLGSEGRYEVQNVPSNRLVQVHGIPTWRGAYFHDDGKTYVVVGLKDSPFLVRREAFGNEEWEEGQTPPQPDQTPFAVRGRILSRKDAVRYESGFSTLESMGEVKPRWIILQGERPGESLRIFLWVGGLWMFLILNVWFLYRDVASRIKR